MADGSVNSSERTVSNVPISSVSSTVSSLSSAHHFISIKLTYKNYLFWRAQVVPFLRGHDLMGFVDGSNPCPSAFVTAPVDGTPAVPNPDYAAWVRQDQAVLSMLISSLSDEVMALVLGRHTSKAVWEAVEQSLASSSHSRALNLLGQLQGLRQGDSSVADYIGRARIIVEDLVLAGRPVSLEEQNLYVFRGLRPEFRTVTASLNVRGRPVSLQELADLLGAEEFIAGGDYGGSSPAAFAVQRGGSGRGYGGQSRGAPGGRSSGQWQQYGADAFSGGSNQQQQSSGQSRGGGGGRNRGGGRGNRGRGNRGGNWRPKCQICGTLGHTALNCYQFTRGHPQANMTYQDSPSEPGSNMTMWFPDTGATHHATPDLAALSSSNDYNGDDTLRVGNGMGLNISHIGHASLNTPSRALSLSNVLHVPQLSNSLLSVQKFASDNKVFFEFHPSFFVVKDSISKEVLLRGSSSGGLYSMPVPVSSPSAFLTARASSSVWHSRLGHPHSRVLSRILQSCSVSQSSNTIRCNSSLCNACQLGKSARFPLPRVESSSSNVLDLIYTDIWGPAPLLSTNGYRYFVIFVDDYSRYTWFFPMKLKSDLYAIFDKFRALVERSFNRKIKSLQSDLGAEYKKLHHSLVQLGIHHRQSCAYTHEQNGRVERKHRHIVETGLSLMAHASVPSKYWDYAFETAVYLVNKMPSPVLHNSSPHALLHKSPPSYSFLRVFGCLCYPYLRPYNRHKMDYRSSPCVFLGYPESFRGYRCMDLVTNKIYVCRHVRFDEERFPFATKSPLQVVPSPNPAPWAKAVFTPPDTVALPPSAPPATAARPRGRPRGKSVRPSTRTHVMATRSRSQAPPTALSAQVCPTEPTCYTQAVKHPEWREAMDQEFNALLQNQTWCLVPSKSDMNVIGCKWVFRTKRKADGSIERHKARLVAKGFNQVPGQDFFDTFSPVVKPTTVRLLLSLAISSGWTIRQLDIHNAFLNGHLSETVYMKQPPGYIDAQFPNHVCLLKRSLYGLKQAPRAWFNRLHTFLLSVGFQASKTDVSLFYYSQDSSFVYLLVYVDDILVMGTDTSLVAHLISKLSTAFKIRDLGEPGFFLGIETVKCDDGILLSQSRYMTDILKRAGMADCKPLSTPIPVSKSVPFNADLYEDPTQYRSLAGALQYLTVTRPDLSFAVNQLCQQMHAPTVSHWEQLKRVLRYVKGTLTFGLRIRSSSSREIHAFSDSDWAGCPQDRKSTSGYAVFLGTNLVSWVCKKQRTVARSSTEAEYKALADVCAEVIWVISLLRELKVPGISVPKLWCDNLGATYMSSNPIFHARTKHVEIDYHFVRDRVASGDIQVNFISTKDQLADIFTKALPGPRFTFLRDKLQVTAIPCA